MSSDELLVKPRVYISAGSFHPQLTTSLRVDSKIGIGTELNLEDDFKLENEMNVFRISGIFRLSDRSQIVGSYTNINRSNTLTLNQSFEFKDTTFEAGARAKIDFDVFYYALTYRYAVFDKANWNAGLSGGLRYVKFKTGIDANFNSEFYSATASIGAPAVLFGIHGSGYLTPKLLARYSLEYFWLSVSGIDLRILETNMTLSYFITKNIGIGAGYLNSNYRIKDIPLSDDFNGKVIFAFEGFNAFLNFRF